MEEMQEYVILWNTQNEIHHNGTRWATFEMLRSDFPEAAIVPADEVPENWRDMTVENGELVLATAKVLNARREAETARKAETLRRQRDELLADTDKYMVPDFPITEQQRELYLTYRQYLRNLPESEDFPNMEMMTFNEYVTG